MRHLLAVLMAAFSSIISNAESIAFVAPQIVPLTEVSDVIGENYYYVANVQIGTPAQSFKLSLNTFDDRAFVAGVGCSQCRNPPSGTPMNVYNQTASSTATNGLYTSYSYFGYGSGVIDTLRIGEITLEADTTAKQPMIFVANDVQSPYLGISDGILGLAQSLTGKKKLDTITSILSQFEDQSFTLFLDRTGSGKSQLTLGGFDEEHCEISRAGYNNLSDHEEQFAGYIPPQNAFWQVELDSYTYGKNGTLGITNMFTHLVALDSVGYNAMLRAIKAQKVRINGAVKDALDCGVTAPDLTFTVGGQDFSIPSSVYIDTKDIGNGKCLLLVENSYLDYVTFGPDFFKQFCGLFDLGGRRMGFAPVK